MIKHHASRSGFFKLRFVVAAFFCLCAIFLAALSLAAESRQISVNRTRGGSINAPSGPGWSLIASPNSLTPNNDVDGVINDVTCFATNCYAVGSYNDNGNLQTLIEHWNGNAWSIITSPNVGTAQDNSLSGITCLPWGTCFAVGSYVKPTANGNFYQTLIEVWDGASWSIVPSPNISTDVTVNNQLTKVTCDAATSCFAVGYYATGIYYPGSYYQTLIEHWDGNAWSIVTSPNASATADNYLYGIACRSAGQCFAAGYMADNRTGIASTLVEQWNGTSWSIVSSANTGNWNQLYNITCMPSGPCFAVGRYLTDTGYGRTLILQWGSGPPWSIVTSPNNGTLSNSLGGVSCISSTNCFAVGGYFNGADSADETLIEQWNGTSWSIVPSPNGDTATNGLSGVVCIFSTQCFAIGYYQTPTSGNRTLFEQWNGSSWSVLTSPPPQITPNRLNNVSCASTTNCFAVGTYYNGSNYQTVIEHWDGTSWSIVASPNASPLWNNVLYGVTCTSATQCFAVGFYTNPSGSPSRALIEGWDGTSWSVLNSPSQPGNASAQLYSVTCTSETNCFAVGYYYDGNTYRTLIEHWDGTSWSISASPNTGTSLYGISCNSATDCFAVGSYLIHWDGTSWSIVSSPIGSLYDVKCSSATQCFAVGNFGSPSRTIIERWDGSAWSIFSSPNTSATEANVLYGVDCLSGSDCWAVGFHGTSGSTNQMTLTEHWDGTGWSIVSSPNAGGSFFLNVSCSAGPQCWAVGQGRPSYEQTLIEEYTPTIPALTSVGSRMTHGSAGTFDINLPLTGSAGIECRTSSGLGAGNYSVIFNFVNNVTSCGSAATAGGTVVAGPNANQCTMNLTGVSDAQTINVELDNVIDAQSNTGNVSVPMGVLFGDASGDGLVNVGDTILVRNHSGETATTTNFREDLNADGLINVGDTAVVRSHSGDFLP